MCGIVGIIGSGRVTHRLVEGLRRLEYRGYDSAGIAVLNDAGELERRRAQGKISELDARIAAAPLDGGLGIGHTRWATHGAPTEDNAHPHASGSVAIVHNGIIENHQELKEALAAQGFAFESQTDSEVIAHLIASHIRSGLGMGDAFRRAIESLRGAYALAAIDAREPDAIWVARAGSPLVIGLGQGENYVGSDSLAVAGWTNRVIYLDDGDFASVHADGTRIFDKDGAEIVRPVTVSQSVAGFADKGNHRHFMVKEIYEQPDAIARTVSRYLDAGSGRLRDENDPRSRHVDLVAPVLVGRDHTEICEQGGRIGSAVRHLEHVAVGRIAQDDGNFFEFELGRSPPASLAGDELVEPVDFANNERLDHAVLTDRTNQLVEILLVKPLARDRSMFEFNRQRFQHRYRIPNHL